MLVRHNQQLIIIIIHHKRLQITSKNKGSLYTEAMVILIKSMGLEATKSHCTRMLSLLLTLILNFALDSYTNNDNLLRVIHACD